jgi:hypothetical protein
LDRNALRELDDTALVALLVARDEAAWREFMRRYNGKLRAHVRRCLARAMREMLPSDAVDDVIGDLHLLILQKEMGKLRWWLTRGRPGTFGKWLGFLAAGIAIDHVRASFGRERGKQRLSRVMAEQRTDPGAAWLGAERAADIGLASDQPKPRRKRKSRDDE